MQFSHNLIKWDSRKNSRQMPWKGEKDPYRVWLSEIILQQTRVEQGLAYYNRFLAVFPDIHSLARAPEEQVFKLWEGLGYYTRCRNLIATAKTISKAGHFPDTYNGILQLKGVGPYTAAAIASFAFNLPHAVVDGNVFRVLSRVFGIDTPIDSTNGKKYFTTLAEELLDKKQPGIYNQAIMDFGAVICKPVSPLCDQCVFKKNCNAFLTGRIGELPVRNKKITIKKRWFYYLVPAYNDELLIRERNEKDIWRNLHEFVLVETPEATPVEQILKMAQQRKLIVKNGYSIESVSEPIVQQLTHQKIHGQFIRLRLSRKTDLPGGQWIPGENLHRYAFPALINTYLKG
jgi:A/G-specific adenine glycosylase